MSAKQKQSAKARRKESEKKPGSRAQRCSAGGRARVSSKTYSTYVKHDDYFIIGNRRGELKRRGGGEETYRGRNRGEEIKDKRKETEGKK